MDIRRRIMMNSIPNYLRLPSAYEKIPYVTADGNQVIRTEYHPVNGDEYHARFSPITGTGGTLFSAGAGTYQLVLIVGFSGTGWYYRYMRSDTTYVKGEYTLNEWYDIDIDGDGTLHTNGITVACQYEAPLDGTATNLYLFERRNWTQPYSGSVSEFWIKNNSQYKMYFIPCRRKSDQKVGMYDTIGKQFYTSARSDFIAGT